MQPKGSLGNLGSSLEPQRGFMGFPVPWGLGFFILSELRKPSRDHTPAFNYVLKVTNTVVLSVAVHSEN